MSENQNLVRTDCKVSDFILNKQVWRENKPKFNKPRLPREINLTRLCVMVYVAHSHKALCNHDLQYV